MPAKRPAPRLPVLDEAQMNDAQRALMEAIRSGPRGKSITPRGPFAVWLHAPEFGQLAQALGGHCRYKTALAPRLSEFAILCTATLWRAQYEWFAHAPMAQKAGVKSKTIQDLRSGRVPKSAPKDERAIYDLSLIHIFGHTVADEATRIGTDAFKKLTDEIETRPLIMLGVAAGIGFLFGLANRR